jgi:tetratricopeptide (TPR) repeat protein
MNQFHPHPRQRPISAASALLLAAMAIGVSGCASMGSAKDNANANPLAASQPDTHLFDAIPKDSLNTASRQLAAEGIKALDAKDYRKASDIFNLAVKTDMTNSYLHFLNAVAYQMRGITGESGLLPLAEQGYQMAVKFDNSNWLARYYAGLLAMSQRNWGEAQRKLVEAAIYAGKQPDLLYDLAVASYYNHDPKTAAAALTGLRDLQKGNKDDPRVLRASAIVAAALNQKKDAQNFLDQLRASINNPTLLASTAERVTSWSNTYDRSGLIKTQFPGSDAFPDTVDEFPATPPADFDLGGATEPPDVAANGDFVEKKMVVVDVVILSTEEDNTHSMGVNLLDGLKLQFGNPATLTPGYSDGTTWTTDLSNSANSTASQVITSQITMPAVTYSLNIANANAKRNEVLARPTLVALGNQTSNFFSGVDVNAAAVSNGQGSAVQIQKEVGVKLSVTPEFLPGRDIKLNIAAERTFLAIPSTSVKFDFRLDTTKTTVNANVVMKFGETLILSGLSERDQSRDRDGVPGLQDIPIVQYLFSRNVTRDYYKSVLILLTPRRAQYSNRSPEDIAADNANLSPADLALADFEDKYRPWFKPIPNVGEITHQLGQSSLFREFQTGDLGGTWQRITNRNDRLNTAMEFLFY